MATKLAHIKTRQQPAAVSPRAAGVTPPIFSWPRLSGGGVMNPWLYVMNDGYFIRLDPETGATLNYVSVFNDEVVNPPGGGTIGDDGNVYIAGGQVGSYDGTHGLLAKVSQTLDPIDANWGGGSGPKAQTLDVVYSYRRQRFYVVLAAGYHVDEELGLEPGPDLWDQPLLELDNGGNVTDQLAMPAFFLADFDRANNGFLNPLMRLAISNDGNTLYYSVPDEDAANTLIMSLNLATQEHNTFADVGARDVLGMVIGPGDGRLYITFRNKAI